MARIRLNMNFTDTILQGVDEYAGNLGITRTAAVMSLLGQALQALRQMETLQRMNNYLAVYEKIGSLPDSEQLAAVEREIAGPIPFSAAAQKPKRKSGRKPGTPNLTKE